MITSFGPGVYDLPEDAYHADPVPGGSLSVSGAKKLLPPSCPAKFAYERENPPAPSSAMELGTAAHKLVLGTGQELAVIDARDWRTNKARDAAGAARAEGKVPLLTAEHEQVQAMAKAISGHPLASALLCHGDVEPEQSMFWPDPAYGIWRRARLDAARQPGSGRLIITDYKTAASAEPGKFAKAVYDYRYHMQAAWYLDAAAACLGEHDAAFLFVAQEKTAPYLTGVYGLDQDSLDLGRAMNERAMERYRDCTESGIWPGYQPDGVGYLSLPPWAYTREDYL